MNTTLRNKVRETLSVWHYRLVGKSIQNSSWNIIQHSVGNIVKNSVGGSVRGSVRDKLNEYDFTK